MPEEATQTMKAASNLLGHIDTYMNKTQSRVRDVFFMIGKGDVLNISDLAEGLESILHSLGLTKHVQLARLPKMPALSECNSSKSLVKQRKQKMERVLPPPKEVLMRKNHVNSTGYGYGKIKPMVKTTKERLQKPVDHNRYLRPHWNNPSSPPMKMEKIGSNQLIISDQAKLDELVATSSKRLGYKSKLSHVEDHLSKSLQYAARDMSMRPGLSDGGTDGAYMNVRCMIPTYRS